MESSWRYWGWWGNTYANTIRRAARILSGPLAGLWLIQRIGDQSTGLPSDLVVVEYSPADMLPDVNGFVSGFYAPTLYPFPTLGGFPYGLHVIGD